MENYRSITDLAEVKELLSGDLPVAFDFETAPDEPYRDDDRAALDPHKAHIVGISFSMEEGDAFYVPLAHKVGINLSSQTEFLEFLRKFVFENLRRVKIAHNLSFEAMFLYAKGIVVQVPCYDTIAAAQLTLKNRWEFRNLHDSGLKLLATQLFHAEMPRFNDVTGGRHFDEMNPQEHETIRYACADSDYTLRLYNKFNAWFDKYMPRHRVITEELESPTSVYCGLMKYNGVPIDRETMVKRNLEATERIAQIREELNTMTDGVDVGVNAATAAFKNYLFRDLGLPVMKVTEKNQTAADDATMQMLREWCAENRPELTHLFELVQEYRKWGKLKSTYIDGYFRYINDTTGRIHPELMPLGTETGRFACRKPNMQNSVQPGHDPLGVRDFICAPDGYVIMEADYSQVELRIAAYLSRDRVMLDAYASGEDIHAITTSAVFGISLAEAKDKHHPEYKSRRTVAKATMFGIMYGIYAKGLSLNLKQGTGIPYTVEECKSYIKGILDRYTGLAQWQKDVKNRAYELMYSETEMGRRRYLPNIRSSDSGKKAGAERMAMNSPVQGLAADCLKYGMANLVAALKGRDDIFPLMTVHDSLVFMVKEEAVPEVIPIVHACMEKPLIPDMPALVAEVSIGKRYGSMEDVE